MVKINKILIASYEDSSFQLIKNSLIQTNPKTLFIHSKNEEETIFFFISEIPDITYIDSVIPYLNARHILEKIMSKIHFYQSVIVFTLLDQETIDPLREYFKSPLVDFFFKDILENNLSNQKYLQNLFYEIKSSLYFHTLRLQNHKIYKTLLQPKFPNTSSHQEFLEDNLIKKLKKNNIEVIIIIISTGGPSVFKKLIHQIKKLTVPIVVIQHILESFLEDYCQVLRKLSLFDVKILENETKLQPKIYFSPVKTNIEIHKQGNDLYSYYTQKLSPNGYKPSGEIIFESLLKEDINILGIIMTGIGDDGTNALAKLHQIKNTATIAQAPSDAYAFGMPRILIEKKAADAIFGISEIANTINHINQY